MGEMLTNIELHWAHAWIFVFPVWLSGMLFSGLGKRNLKRAVDMSWYTGRDRFFSFLSMFAMFAFMICAAWIEVDYNSWWLYPGLLFIFLGAAGHWKAKFDFMRGQPDRHIHSGLYRFSRNPMYFSFSLLMFGVVIVTLSPLLLFVWLVSVISTHLLILGEENFCLQEYGPEFKNYLKSVPRYFFF